MAPPTARRRSFGPGRPSHHPALAVPRFAVRLRRDERRGDDSSQTSAMARVVGALIGGSGVPPRWLPPPPGEGASGRDGPPTIPPSPCPGLLCDCGATKGALKTPGEQLS